ncbi:MAG: hypothetical protein VX614_04130 [Myxococcota bacterium]|nr:hypothetical protein [Myxococcota bacterium]
MTEESSLIVIAEVAAALAGFSGIAAAFGRRQERPWTEVERARLSNLLNHSGIALFAALVPLVLALDGGFTPEHWRISSLFWAAFASIGIGLGVRSGWASWAANSPGRRFAFLLQLGGFILLLVLQLWNAIAVQKGWPYLLGLVGNLGYAFIHFMGLVNPSADRSEG